MKILYYSPHPLLNLSDPSGYATHMREMIAAWKRQGHEVHILIMGGVERTDNQGAAGDLGGAKSLVKRFIPSLLWQTARDIQLDRFDRYAAHRLEEESRVFQPDLIYERANYLQLSGVKMAKKLNIKHYLEVNSPYVEERQSLSGRSLYASKASQAEHQQLLLTDRVVVVSTALRKYFVDKWQVAPEKFIITPNAINPEKITPSPELVAALREKLGLAGKTVMGFVGSIFRWHGVDILIEAFSRLETADNHLLIVGDGEIRSELEEKVGKLGLKDRVTFTGSVSHEDVFSYLALMDITLLPNSHWYGSPIKIFEYGAMGKAIIAPDNVPVRDVMVPGQDGLLVQPQAASVYQAMETLLENPTQCAAMATHFQQKVLREHTWDQMAHKILSHATEMA